MREKERKRVEGQADGEGGSGPHTASASGRKVEQQRHCGGDAMSFE